MDVRSVDDASSPRSGLSWRMLAQYQHPPTTRLAVAQSKRTSPGTASRWPSGTRNRSAVRVKPPAPPRRAAC